MDSIAVENVSLESVTGEVVPVESVPVESLSHCWQFSVDISVYLSPLQIIVAVKCVTVMKCNRQSCNRRQCSCSATIDGLTANSGYNGRHSNRQQQ